jgi:3'-5' exonuclease
LRTLRDSLLFGPNILYINRGGTEEIADYCKSDVINTYRLWLWLRHELFRGRLDQNQFEFSELDVGRFVGPAER